MTAPQSPRDGEVCAALVAELDTFLGQWRTVGAIPFELAGIVDRFRPAAPSEPPAVPDLMGALRRSVCRHLTWDVNTETGTAHCARCGVPWADTQPLAEARCSENGCWYTLPVVDGLIVSHSAPMTLDNCEGSGKPPAETQQDGRPLGEVIYTAWTGQPYWGGCDQRENVERVLDALAARPSADTEKLLPVRAEIIRQVREAAWHDGYEACRRGDQPHNPYRAALDGPQ